MKPRSSGWLAVLAIAALSLLSAIAPAQNLGTDWPMFKGNLGRTGVNGAPPLPGPNLLFNGQPNGTNQPVNLHWFTPAGTAQAMQPLIVDNADFNGVYTSALTGPVNGLGTQIAQGTFSVNNFANWAPDPEGQNDAEEPYLVDDGQDDGNSFLIAYFYSTCVNQQSSTDPTSGATASATWTFTPPTGQNGLYGLYVWIPIGPQLSGGTTLTFPQRYYVYQIQASGRLFTDVVDTYQSGGGWVRLGNGGQPTNMVFPYDGINPLAITLFNTIPNGSLGVPSQLVYADAAMAVPQTGYYYSSPVSAQLTPGTQSSTRVYAALNQLSSGGVNGAFTTVTTGVLSAYPFIPTVLGTSVTNPNPYDIGNPVWTYSPVESGSAPVAVDNSSGSTTGAGFTQNAVSTRYSGAYASVATLAGANPAPPATANITYNPALNTGTYQIFAYIPGNNNGLTFGQAVQYSISEGGLISTFSVNQSVAGGWVQIGTRRYTNATGFPLTVTITNSSPLATDTGLLAYANAMRFVGEQNQAINSTPVIATVGIRKTLGGAPVPTQVVVVGDENGFLHCLDATGKGDGTTTEYWSYPSTLGLDGTDPNQVAGLDLGAEMPSGFQLSSAAVTPVTTAVGVVNNYLYVGTTNGRVYCIDMAGRGDFNTPNRVVGTTTRVWTYPSTGPNTTNSNLGPFQASIVFDVLGPVGTLPTPTNQMVFVPAEQGRMYALNAVGNPGTETTNSPWQFPALTQPTLGQIWATPAVGLGNIYFGTRQTLDGGPGQLYSLNETTGAVNWAFQEAAVTDAVSQVTANVPFGDFLSGFTFVPTADIATGYTANDGILYVANQNGYIMAVDGILPPSALDPATNALSMGTQWNSDELYVGVQAPLSFTNMLVDGNTGTNLQANVVAADVLMVPTLDGRFDALFADPGVTNVDLTRRAFEYVTPSTSIISGIAISNNWFFGADTSGFLYGFNNDTALQNSESGDQAPGGQTIVENNPAGNIFRHATVASITAAGYNTLRQPIPSNGSYTQALGFIQNQNPLAFEWGQTMYIMVYNFPFLNTRERRYGGATNREHHHEFTG